MPSPSPAAARLARRLRELREREWPDQPLTQALIAAGLSTELKVGAATVSSWESTTNPKLPPRPRLEAYARFFATRRSLDPQPRLLPLDELLPEEKARQETLEVELLALHDEVRRPPAVEPEGAVRRSWQFLDDGPLTIICPDAPLELRGGLASSHNLNYTDSHKYADLDALIELYGHVRAENPTMTVHYRRASRIDADDLSGHVVLLGGVAWNDITRRLQVSLTRLPVRQIDDPQLPEGDAFEVTDDPETLTLYPELMVIATGSIVKRPPFPREGVELVEDVAWLARMPNPFNSNRTFTICNGVYSRGVLGAVRCLTDARVRDANENYLARRFPRDEAYTVLMRVPVLRGKTLSPDLQTPRNRLYEWPPARSVSS